MFKFKKPLVKHGLFNESTAKESSFFRKQNSYLKNKNSKVRLYCKGIVLFCLTLNFILITELHSIYYSVSINLFNVKYFLYSFVLSLTLSITLRSHIRLPLAAWRAYLYYIRDFYKVVQESLQYSKNLYENKRSYESKLSEVKNTEEKVCKKVYYKPVNWKKEGNNNKKPNRNANFSARAFPELEREVIYKNKEKIETIFQVSFSKKKQIIDDIKKKYHNAKDSDSTRPIKKKNRGLLRNPTGNCKRSWRVN